MTDSIGLAEFSPMSSIQKMILRLNAAAEAVEFSQGALVSAGDEPKEADEHFDAASVTKSKRYLPQAVAPRVEHLTDADPTRKWMLVDAEGVVLGRLATVVANLLRGKNAPTFTPHLDVGAHVIVINADKVQMTGKKRDGKVYYWHTGHPGGMKQRTAKQVLEGAHPERVVMKAVERMITRNRLGRRQMTNLHVFAGTKFSDEVREMINFDLESVLIEKTSSLRSKNGKSSL